MQGLGFRVQGLGFSLGARSPRPKAITKSIWKVAKKSDLFLGTLNTCGRIPPRVQMSFVHYGTVSGVMVIRGRVGQSLRGRITLGNKHRP